MEIETELEISGAIVLDVFQKTPVDRPEFSEGDSQGVMTLKSEQRFFLIESAATLLLSLHANTIYSLVQVDQVIKPGRVSCRNDLKTFTLVNIGAKEE